MTRASNSSAPPSGYSTLSAPADRGGLDLFDVIALAWSQRGFIALIFAVLFALGVAASLTLVKPSYEAQTRLLILLEGDPTPAAAGTGGAFMLDQIMQSESELLGSAAVQRLALETLGPETVLGEPGSETVALRALASSFSVDRAPNSSALMASYEAGDADRAALVLNTLVDTYLAYRQQVLVSAGAEALAGRRVQADEAVVAARGALDAFLSEHALANFDSDKLAAETSVTTLQDRLRTARADRDSAAAGAEALSQRLGNIPESIELYVENGASTLLLDRRVERQQLLSRYQPSAPPVLAVEREIAAIEGFLASGAGQGLGQRRTGANPVRQAMESELATRRANAEAEANRAVVLERQLRVAQGEVARLRGLEAEHTRLAQNVNGAVEAAALLAGQEAVAAARRPLGTSSADAVRVFDRATPPLQAQSMKKIALLASAVLAAGVAVFAGLIRGYWVSYLSRPHSLAPSAPVEHADIYANRYAGAAAAYETPPPVQPVDPAAGLPVLARISDRTA